MSYEELLADLALERVAEKLAVKMFPAMREENRAELTQFAYLKALECPARTHTRRAMTNYLARIMERSAAGRSQFFRLVTDYERRRTELTSTTRPHDPRYITRPSVSLEEYCYGLRTEPLADGGDGCDVREDECEADGGREADTDYICRDAEHTRDRGATWCVGEYDNEND